ncbi:alpha/beta fold hydrolase [Ottowia thiooxydans]|uniref:Pimeloyl-ACP methyl ester carboxylesterase n=1 Tax=Ottowia thiooxydans TaxID=219182 RepID=A0ABV2Q3F0_9BURK
MPYARGEGACLYFEDSGQGPPLVFAHEFAADGRAWEEQVRSLSVKYRCIIFNARGYPPSDVPHEAGLYSQEIAADDIRAVLDAAAVTSAYVVGLSMGATAALEFGLRHPRRTAGLIVAGAGSGSGAIDHAAFVQGVLHRAERVRELGMAAVTESIEGARNRTQLKRKSPAAWQRFLAHLSQHNPLGAAMTLENVQAKRPVLGQMQPRLVHLQVPTLLMAGDEDEDVLEAQFLLKRWLPNCGLRLLPRAGHAVNLEEPEEFNAAIDRFITEVEAGTWGFEPSVR